MWLSLTLQPNSSQGNCLILIAIASYEKDTAASIHADTLKLNCFHHSVIGIVHFKLVPELKVALLH